MNIKRDLTQGQRVRVYYNLHKKCYSIISKIEGRWLLVAHAERVTLHNAKTIVSQAGRNRVLESKRKNVHAYIEGDFYTMSDMIPANMQAMGAGSLYYNPYEVDCFVDKDSRKEVKTAKLVHMQDRKAIYLPA